ncbi:beta-lactamase family protein [candidate division KSB1 bacterium]|nr:beta-lactamase family protein [candidate division KSB1 bacterium]
MSNGFHSESFLKDTYQLDFCKNDLCVISTNGRNLFTHIIELNRFLANARNDKLSCFAEVYLPLRKEDDAELTLRHLATHTSGLPRDFVNRVNVDPPGGPGVAKAYSIKELYEGLNISKITGTVGTYAYSNLNFGLLGHVLERAAGVPYEQLLKQRILEPLQMLDSFVQIPPEKEGRFATAYWPNFGPEEDRDPWFFGEISGAGGLTSSVPDLAKFISLQFKTEDNKQKPISGATVRELWTPQPVEVNRGAIAFGWHIREIENTGKWVLHGGEVDGFSSLVAFKPEQEIGIIVLTNFGNNTAQNMAVPLMEIVWDWLKKS